MKKVIRISTIVIIFSALLIATIATISLSYAGQGTQGKVISGSASILTTAPCRSEPETCIMDRLVDLDGDLVDDYLMTTRQVLHTVTGILEGMGFGTQTITQDLNTNKAYARSLDTFTGTVGDSEPGSFSWVTTFVSDRSQAPDLIQWEGNIVIVEGSGTGGLEGICGGGTYQGSGNAIDGFISTSNYEFRFGDACRGNN